MASEEESLNKPYRSSSQMACGSGSYTGGQVGFAYLPFTLRLWQDSGASTPHYGSVLFVAHQEISERKGKCILLYYFMCINDVQPRGSLFLGSRSPPSDLQQNYRSS